MGFVLVGYYTVNSIYEDVAKQLENAARGLGVKTDIIGICDRGGWGPNTEYKATFIRDCMSRHPGEDIAYTDADSMIHSYPLLFDNPTADAIVRTQDFPWRRGEFLSGTFFMRNNESCARAVQLWINKIAACKTIRNRPDTWEQYHLGKALVESGVSYSQLPPEYICFDHIERVEGKITNPVFTHMQYSRKTENRRTNENV